MVGRRHLERGAAYGGAGLTPGGMGANSNSYSVVNPPSPCRVVIRGKTTLGRVLFPRHSATIRRRVLCLPTPSALFPIAQRAPVPAPLRSFVGVGDFIRQIAFVSRLQPGSDTTHEETEGLHATEHGGLREQGVAKVLQGVARGHG